MSLPALVAERAASDPDRTFVQDVAGDRASYGESLHRSERWAAALVHLGVRPGDRIVTMIANSVEGVMIGLGISMAGAIEVPVHSAFVGYMLEHTVNTVGASVAIVEAPRAAAFTAPSTDLPGLKHLVVLGNERPPERSGRFSISHRESLLQKAGGPVSTLIAERWDTAAILFTSGTTGPSKGVVVPWGQIEATARRTFPLDDLSEADVIYVFTPASHIGAKALPYLAALLGGSALLRPDFRLNEFLPDIRRFGITTAPIIGTIPQFLSQSTPQPDDADIPLRNVVMAPLLPGLDDFAERFGVRICTAYNMTELCVPFASEGWTTTNHASVGVLLQGWPGTDVRLVNPHDEEVPAGSVGELVVRTSEPWTMNQGYYGMPEATLAAWRNGWFHTGDAFRRDTDGYFYFVDRLKDSIRRRGENISSFEVEMVANVHPEIAESAAVAVPAETGDDEVMLVAVRAPGSDLDPAELTRFMAERLPRFMVPRYLQFVEELPKTAGTMRVRKHELRERGLTDSTWDREWDRARVRSERSTA